MTLSPQMLFHDNVRNRTPVIAIIRGGEDASEHLAVFEWLKTSGVEIVEVTTNTPNWPTLVSQAKEFGFSDVGVGTVVTVAHVEQADACGASFTVAPGLDSAVVKACNKVGLAHLPGVMTPSEIQQAMALGLSLVKLFPAGSLGIDYLRSLQGPFGEVSFVPTGGVSLDSAPAWLDAGAVAVGIGGALVSADQTKREQMKSQIRALSERT